MLRAVLCLACLTACCFSVTGTAQASKASYVKLLRAVALRAAPLPNAPVVHRLAARQLTGAPEIARIVRVTVIPPGVWWVDLQDGPSRGWVLAQLTAPAAPPDLFSPALSRYVQRSSVSSRASLLLADAATGQVLAVRLPTRVRALASVTKLFVTAAALARFGTRVGRLLARILLPSNNNLAEQLNQRLGGARAVNAYAHHLGANVQTVGGSGRDPRSRASAAQTVRFLLAMRHQHDFNTWEHDLPLAGRTGTLAARMRGSAAQGRCFAKTGTLRISARAANLAGYCTTRHHHQIAFAIFSADSSLTHAHVDQDEILAAVVSHY